MHYYFISCFLPARYAINYSFIIHLSFIICMYNRKLFKAESAYQHYDVMVVAKAPAPCTFLKNHCILVCILHRPPHYNFKQDNNHDDGKDIVHDCHHPDALPCRQWHYWLPWWEVDLLSGVLWNPYSCLMWREILWDVLICGMSAIISRYLK